MRAFDRTSGRPLALDLAVAQTIYARSRGLLGRRALPAGSGLWITPCNAIHTIGMKFPIDVLFLDRDNRVVALAKALPPNRLTRIVLRSRSVLELPAGTLEAAQTREGNQVEIAPSDPRPQPRPAGTPWRIILYLLLLAGNLALLWRLPFFPTQDGPSHLYNLVILDDLLHGGARWGAFYTCSLKAVPNLGFHLVAYPLLQGFSPGVTEKIFVSLYLILTALCVPYLLRSFGKPAFPLSFLVFPVLFNYTLMMGFYSFTIAVPLCLAALALAWRVRHEPLVRRWAAVNLCGAFLYFCHLTPWVIFLLAVGLHPLADEELRPPGSWVGSRVRALGRQAALMAPQIALFCWYLAGAFPHASRGYDDLFSLSRTAQLFAELLLFSTVTFSKLQLLPSAALLATICLVGRASLKGAGTRGRMSEAGGSVGGTGGINAATGGDRPPLGEVSPPVAQPDERYLAMLVALLVLIYFLAPFRLGDGAYFNERFPWVVYLLMLPLFRLHPGELPHLGSLAASLAVVFLVFNAGILTVHSRRVQDFVTAAPVLPGGSQVMMYKDDVPTKSPVDPLLHAVSYSCMIHRYVDVGNYETRFSYFPVRFSPALPKLPAPETIATTPASVRWTEFPSIEYVFGVAPARTAREGLGRFFRLLHERGPFSLWQRRADLPGTGKP